MNDYYYVLDSNCKEIERKWSKQTGEFLGFNSNFSVFLYNDCNYVYNGHF